MFLAITCPSLLLALQSILCNAATIPYGDGSLVDTPAPLINISLPLLRPPATSPSNDIQVQCRGSQFGNGLSYSSCLDAFSTFKEGESSATILIGRRGTGVYVRYLPWKWVSGTGSYYPPT